MLALNGTPVNRELPVKSVAIDLEDGAAANFSVLRLAPPTPAAPTAGYPPVMGAAAASTAPTPTSEPLPPAPMPTVVAEAAPVENEDDALLRCARTERQATTADESLGVSI